MGDSTEVDRRRTAEAVRAAELAAVGHLVRPWRPVGELRSVGLWRAADEAELYEKVLGSLPCGRGRLRWSLPSTRAPTTQAAPATRSDLPQPGSNGLEPCARPQPAAQPAASGRAREGGAAHASPVHRPAS
ncbi:muconolactone Delta-isomerase family protein [Embleya scabrispora]|uniref:muconolactone Delta-isomerase family protein n=1 Tax=Embleya scabrispora TaxID=159449 RepID=UPI003CCBFC98